MVGKDVILVAMALELLGISIPLELVTSVSKHS